MQCLCNPFIWFEIPLNISGISTHGFKTTRSTVEGGSRLRESDQIKHHSSPKKKKNKWIIINKDAKLEYCSFCIRKYEGHCHATTKNLFKAISGSTKTVTTLIRNI